jgi:pyruvate/2-oxoglutarate dehydrogenase complex dihydrolipoamide dehydrogenase (E3) component
VGRDYDMVVIGGGAAGLVAAGMSAVLGAKTALIEEHRLGGDCTWTGCVPSKTLLKAAKVAHQTRVADRYGLVASAPAIDFRRLMEHVRAVRNRIYEDADAPPNLEKLGVTVIASRARFVSRQAVELTDGSHISSRYFVIATGSRPRMPDFRAPVLHNENLFELSEQPRRLVVMGAGPVGIEMAQAFRRLGSEVTVVGSADRILPKDDPELTGMLQQALEAEGIAFRLGRRVTGFEQGSAALDDGSVVACDAVLAAIGRQPAVDGLGLDAAGVVVEERGIRIDRHCRTSQRHIYGSGDVTGRHLFTHMAEHMSKVAVSNAILHVPLSMDEERVAWCTYTDPELAHVGAAEGERFYRFPFTKLDRAIVDGETTGLVKVIADAGGRIRGASVLGANAGEMIAEWALAMKGGLKLAQVADTIHPYPAYVMGNRRAADQWYTGQLNSRWLDVLAKILRYRGVRRGM